MAKRSNRRRFLGGAFAGAAASGTVASLAGAKANKKVVVKTPIYGPGETPSPHAVFSPGIQFERLLFVSGQGAFDPRTRQLVAGSFADQVRQCLENVKAILEAGGSSLERVLKASVFLTDIANYKAMNEVYRTYFPSIPPARTTVAVRDLPLGTPIEIDVIAYKD